MASKPLPRVSVCLLTYKRAHLLATTLDSLLAQSHGDFELIINDNQSPDHTEEICRRYEKLDRRVRYFRNPVNVFFAGNQNAAVLRASAEYVALVHDGDTYRADLLEKWVGTLSAEPSAAIVFNTLDRLDVQGRVFGQYRHPYSRLTPGLTMFDEMIRRPDSPIFGITMVRKSCVLSVGPFDPRIPTLADVDMWFRLLLRYDVAYVPEPLVQLVARETTHAPGPPSWSLRREHELIYILNTARRYPKQPERIAALRREIAPMLWKLRVLNLLSALRHGHLRSALDGLSFMTSRPHFNEEMTADSVLDWGGVEQRINPSSNAAVT